MDFENPESQNYKKHTESIYEKEALELIRIISSMSVEAIEKTLKVSGDKLFTLLSAMGNFQIQEGKRAVEAYSGISFKQLEIQNYEKEEWKFIEDKLRILSALYGANRGTDNIKYHRLDMTMKIMDISLYRYWSHKINSSQLFSKDKTIINLASKEFSKLIDKKIFDIIDIDFLEKRNNEYRSISTNSKKARGLMLNYIIKNKIQSIDEIKEFSEDGYKYNIEESCEYKLIFTKEGA
jgi:hypothetical protein